MIVKADLTRTVGARSRMALLLACLGALACVSLNTTLTHAQQCSNRVLQAGPSNYDNVIATLLPGDTLILSNSQGAYPGLSVEGLQGTDSCRITLKGAEGQARPVIVGDGASNTVQLDNTQYVTLKRLEIDGRDLGGDGLNARGLSHHIILEDLYIHGVGDDQQTVGISTNATQAAWDWIIRNNIIERAGTGLYLGDSDGSSPFIRGIIEHNLVYDTIGYNMEIKHQNPRGNLPGAPPDGSKSIIRHNVFSKQNNASSGASARPNVLVGHWPLSGVGMNDTYEIYGNFFWYNGTSEPLFQGEGNIAFYDNLVVNPAGPGVWIQPHNDVPRNIRVFNNTVVATSSGISVTGGAQGFQQKVVGNAVFAQSPINAADQKDNVTDTKANAVNYVKNPSGTPSAGNLDLFPLAGKLTGSVIDRSSFSNQFSDWNKDFNGQQHDATFRGAYSSGGNNPGWLPKIERKPSVTNPDPVPPAAPTGLRVL